jgi:hypothetical protein
MGRESDCGACHLRHQCIRSQNTPARQVHIFYDHEAAKDKALESMKQKIDSPLGRYIYSLRMKIVEPVFANIRASIGLDRFSLRGAKKVDVQWQLFAIIHNIGKITRFGYGFT